MDKLTKLEHLRSASLETKDLIGQVASAAAAAIEELADKKQDVITGKQGQVAGFDAAGNIVAQNSSGSGNGVSYSREETVVGSYNGKPLYSKIVFDNSVQMYSDTLVDVYFDIIEDVDAVVDITLTAKVLHGTNKNLVRWIKFPYVESGMSGYLKTSMSGSNTTQLVWVNLSGANPYRGDWWFKCTALYTKTTDDRYTVTVESSDQASGTVSGAGTYQQGTSVTVTAAPGEGYRFVKWTENGQTVSESTSYTFTVTGDRTLTAVFEEEKTSRLPAGYTEVEYVESTNGQYITTPSGIISSRLVIEVEPTKSFSGTTTQVFFGYCKYTSSVKATYHTGLFRSSAGILGGVGSNDKQLKTLSTDKSLRRMTFEIDSANNRMILDGTATSITISSTSKNLDMAINLLSEYASSTSAVAFAATPAKLYSYKGYDTGGNLTKEYIPCINPSGVAGLYDSVGKQFYPSASSAAFIAGPAV